MSLLEELRNIDPDLLAEVALSLEPKLAAPDSRKPQELLGERLLQGLGAIAIAATESGMSEYEGQEFSQRFIAGLILLSEYADISETKRQLGEI